MPLRPEDKNLTSFITPFGRWRYLRAPQGFLSSGDGYNRRFDAILLDFTRKERCVDDTVHYDTDLEQHWWRTMEFLTLTGNAGIVLNPKKFQFASKTVDFAGFRVSATSVEPQPKFLDAIRSFPTPKTTTDIRSWFGLINQVSNYGQLRDSLTLFRPFLSPRHKFSWSEELDNAFQQSKLTIVDAIRQGVEIFDLQKRTCLRPDWSCQGIGYFLLQKHCTCPSNVPDCCDDGWRITLAGSRFLSGAEERYAAIEGEALAIAWGLEQTRYFTQACEDLVVVTDHKPLVKIFGDRTLDEITNSRLFRIKQRTLPWKFNIAHLPGRTNHAADATSRHPSPTDNTLIDINAPDHAECCLVASIGNEISDQFAITWDRLSQETASNESFKRLAYLVRTSFSDWSKVKDTHLSQFWSIRDALYLHDGVILYQDRVVVPPSLRKLVVQNLHGAHQGVASMEQRARSIVYWPGMTRDIHLTREQCLECNRNAPSQAATPPVESEPPSTPFESIFADFFDHAGRHYLVVGDRLSGWVEVYGANHGTNQAGAVGLVKHLRAFFATFGVPEVLSSDGGPEFTSNSTTSFLRSWGVKHRISSAYFPQSNGRAEVAVKTVKRLLLSNTTSSGNLDHDNFLRAMLQLRNTPDSDCNISPAEIIFGHPLRDTFSFMLNLSKFKNPKIRPMWREAWAAKEDALRTRMARTSEKLNMHVRALRSLKIGERVFVQNQTGANPNKWDKSGTVMEVMQNDQYLIKIDGSGRLTRRNRRFLRCFTPTKSSQCSDPSVVHHLPTESRHTSLPKMPTESRHTSSPTMPSEGRQTRPHTLSGPHPTESGVTSSQRLSEAPILPTEGGHARRHIHIRSQIPEMPGSQIMVDDKVTELSLSDQEKNEDVFIEPQPSNPPIAHPSPTRRSMRRVIKPPKRYQPETGTWTSE